MRRKPLLVLLVPPALLGLLGLNCTFYLPPPVVATATSPNIVPVLTPTVLTPTVLTPTPTPRLATVATTGLRVRSCPDYECRTVGWLRQGDTVQVAGCQSGWAYLPHLSGWSRSIYLSPDPCNNK